MNHYPSTTGDVIPLRCLQCGAPEHGTAGCNTTKEFELVERGFDDLLRGRVRRVMDGQLFEVHPGSPPEDDDHCCLCAYRKQALRG